MKILHLSDLHRHKPHMYKQDNWIAELLFRYNPDIVVATGDLFESSFKMNPYKQLATLFDGFKVIATLGNHECYNRTVQDTYAIYEDAYNPDKYDVHYLDVVGAVDIGKIRFLGNVLFYDGSMANVPGQNLYDWAGGRWADRFIREFDYLKEHERCRDQIFENMRSSRTQILCTHCVPHVKMNGHTISGIPAEFNAYGGPAALLDELEVDYSLSGHTHYRVVGLEINGCKCLNPGSDYQDRHDHCFLEIEEKENGKAR